MGKALDKLLAMKGMTRADIMSGRTRLGKTLCRGGIGESSDLKRIRKLPRRKMSKRDFEILAREMTQLLKTPNGKQRLRIKQALALADAWEKRGLFGPIKCGGGKTLVSFLLITMFDAKRPLLLVPDSHYSKKPTDRLGKTELALVAAAKHWKISRIPTILGYKLLGRHEQEDRLDKEKPDLIIADEAHMLSNSEPAVTRRVGRYLEENPDCVFVALSGTLSGVALSRYQHLADWALGRGSPVPRDRTEATRWEQALSPPDVRKSVVPIGLGELEVFGRTRDDAAAGLNAWMYDTPGFVGTKDIGCGASIEITPWEPKLPTKLREIIKDVQNTHIRPDGVELFDAQLASCLSQLALGFWYCWDPLPPREWLAARREWWKFVREELEKHERGLDTEKQVRLRYPERYAAWMMVEKTFKPKQVTVWESKEVVRAAEKWAGKDGVVWTHFTAFGREIRLPYYGRNAMDEKGRHVEHAKGAICVSARSCLTGVNLQRRHHRALVTTLPAEKEPWEQLLSRHHREGQKQDTVYVSINQTLKYHQDVLRRVRFAAKKTTKAGDEQRLTRATWV